MDCPSTGEWGKVRQSTELGGREWRQGRSIYQCYEPYAIAKIAGLKITEAYRCQYGFDAISLMPTNLYGPGDNFDLQSSHVLPALIRKFHEAKLASASTVTLWGRF